MGKREAANDPHSEPTDEESRIWEALHSTRKRSLEPLELCPPGYYEINVQGGYQISCGRWLLQYFDLALGRRYSIGGTPDGKFFLLCLHDSDRHTTLDWFPDQETIYLSLNISKEKWFSIASFANRKSK